MKQRIHLEKCLFLSKINIFCKKIIFTHKTWLKDSVTSYLHSRFDYQLTELGKIVVRLLIII